MKISEEQIAISSQSGGANASWVKCESVGIEIRGRWISKFFGDTEFGNVFTTFLTTLMIFGIYMIQGIIIARILGPLGRGEFGTAMFFPRDVLLYAGLLGGIEIVNSYAVKGTINVRSLKYSAAKVGLISGAITGLVAAAVAVTVMVSVGKTYLIPFCLLCCLFVPWEHMQLTISAVDRGNKNFRFYNINRLLYAMSLLVLIALVFGLNIDSMIPLSPLWVICGLFVLSRIVGILPTIRGMNVLQTWLGNRAIDSLRLPEEASESVSEAAVSEIAVPSPWTLLKNGRFYALSMLASELFEKLDMFLIVAIASVTESGYYFVAVPAAQLLIIAPNALGVFTFNAGADRKRLVSVRKVVKVMSATAVLQIASALFLSLLLPMLIIAFYKEPFAPAIPFALWLLPACAIKGYLQAVDGYLKGRGKPMVGVWARFLSIFLMLTFVAMVYADLIKGPEQKLLCIPMAACLGQAASMVIISTAVIRDAINRERDFGSDQDGEVSNVLN